MRNKIANDGLRQVLLPFPPSANNLFAQRRMWSNKQRRYVTRRFPTKRYLAWRSEAIQILCTQRWQRPKGRVSISLTLTPPDKRRRDADNLIKPVLDALVKSHVIAGDDHQHVKSVTVSWGDGTGCVGAELTIQAVSA